jgi:hypothetical protein
VLAVKTATVRGSREVTVTFGPPLLIATGKATASDLTRQREGRVQGLLEQRTIWQA